MTTTNGPKLPKKPKDLAMTIENHVSRQEGLMAPQYVMWRLASLYLRGYRTFTTFDTRRGILNASPYILSEDGKREYQSQALAKAISDTASRLATMDARAAVSRNGDSLASVRERAVGQVILDSITEEKTLQEAVEQFSFFLTALGMAGIQGDVVNSEATGLIAVPEVIHPRELLPWPSVGEDFTKTQGIIRQRMIPMDQLVDIFGAKIKSDPYLKEMSWYESEAGQIVADPLAFSGNEVVQEGGFSLNMGKRTNATKTEYVQIRELWTYGPNRTVSDYVVTSGQKMIHQKNYDGLEVYCPIHTARFMENGDWYGQGLFTTLFSIHREMEDLMGRMFENIRDLDKNQTLVVPGSQMPQKPILYNIGDKHSAIGLQSDPMDQSFRPFTIPMNDAGDMPGRTASYAQQIMDSLNPMDDIIRDKGRIDSAEAMGILQEEASKKHTAAMRGINRAFGGYHRSNLASAIRELQTGDHKMSITRLTPELAGIVLDTDRNTMSFRGSNPIPSIAHLKFDVRDVSPKSLSNKKRAAMELFSGTGDYTGLVLHSIREGFELDTYIEEDKAAYEGVVQDILLLFNDGETPQRVILTPQATRPKLQLRVLSAFTASTVFRQSSPPVQDAFMQYITQMKAYLGNVLEGPPGNPDEMASVAATQGAPQ